ncbi:MAG: SMP-30/gluconolactonase/LRE family protein [Myxococcota bacterium]
MDFLEMQRLIDDVPGAEGPIFDRAGRLFYVAPGRGEVRWWDEDSKKQIVFANTDGMPAGLQIDPQNRLWVADMERGLLRIDVDADTVTIYGVMTTFDGQPIRGCNDCALDDAGNLYVTAPAGSNADTPVGELFCWLETEQRGVRLDSGFRFCNGLAVNESGGLLVVAETHGRKLWAYDLAEPGIVVERRLFATLTGATPIGADGIDFDAEGHLLVTNYGEGSLDAFSPDGQRVERFDLPFGSPSNLHLGGNDGCDLYMTEQDTHAVWKGRWRCPGIRRVR